MKGLIPLQLAASLGLNTIVKTLLANRAETKTVRGSTGETAFHQSTVSSGADMIREDNTPLNLAQLSTNIHMANIFLVAGDACTLNSSQR